MRKIILIISICLSLNLFSQPPKVYINYDKTSVNSTDFTVGCSYFLPRHKNSQVYVFGVVWSTSNDPESLKFWFGEYNNDPNNYTEPTAYMKYIPGKTPTGHTIVIGDGGPVSPGGSKMTANVKPGTTYFVRAFLFARLCYLEEQECVPYKDVWYSDIIQVTTPSDAPISDNLITSNDQIICYNSTIPPISAAQPKGANGTYSYQWQSNTNKDNANGWVDIANATSQNYTPTAPSSLNAITPVWYRRVVTSGTQSNKMNNNPVLYTFLPQNQVVSLNISRIPNADKNLLEMKAVVTPDAIKLDNVIWQESNAETGPFSNSILNGNTVNTLSIQRGVEENKFYKVTTNMAQGCPNAESKVVSLTPADGDGNKYLYTKIGNQYWMVENLRVTTYNDKVVIPNVPNNSNWAKSTSGAQCWYGNDFQTNSFMYGSLYNLYIDTTKVCPAGWGVPSKLDWETLIANVPSGQPVLNNLASNDQSYWDPDNNAVINSLNFNLIPSGSRSTNGTFSAIKSGANYWTTTIQSPTSLNFYNYGFSYNINTKNYTWGGSYASPIFGMSIKCIKK